MQTAKKGFQKQLEPVEKRQYIEFCLHRSLSLSLQGLHGS